MNLFADLRALVLDALADMTAAGELPRGLDFAQVAVEPPRDPAHGDMATNAAMVLAKPAGLSPRAIAEALAARLGADPRITEAAVAGPGFLNLRLSPAVWQGLVRSALVEGAEFGRSTLGQGQKVNVEFVSANPTGPMHVGHVRGAVFGDALARLLSFTGFDVTREYYINDGGAQVDVLARSAYERYREANGLEPEIREGLYPGDYLIPVGEALKETYGTALLDKPEAEWLIPDPRLRDQADDGHDPGRSGAAWRDDGRLFLGKGTLRHRADRGCDRGAAGIGPDLRRRAGTARKARRPRTGSRASRRCSARPRMAMTWTVR